MRASNVYRRGFRRADVRREDNPEFWKAFDAQVAEIRAEREAEKPENWLQGRQVALLLIERSAAALDCIAHMVGTARPQSQDDFLFLRENGYAIRKLGERYHRLTPYGARAAHELINSIGKRLNLHHVTYQMDSWYQHKAKCCCGFSAACSRRGYLNPRSVLEAAIARHLADPEDWKRRRDTVQAMLTVGGSDAS